MDAGKIGAHAGEANNDSIGVCLAGNFVSREPEIEQIEALLSLIDYLEDHYGKPLPLLRHCDVMTTVCPGNMFPWPLPGRPSEQWKQKLVDQALEEGLITETHDPGARQQNIMVIKKREANSFPYVAIIY